MKTIYKKLLFLLLLLPFSVLAQNTLNGVVLDKNSKQPIPGVNVTVQGSPNGTQSDFDGKFQLPVKKGDVVVFSYLGYKNFSVTYDAQKNLTVSLEEEANQLSEVVVQIGYGTVSKKDATGAVALVTTKDFNKGAIVSVDQLLSGKAAGVRITTSGGSPDAAPDIRIRGGASLSASNSPLIVIDGVPIGNENPAGISNPFTLVNPNDVESFSILKDASATAIYGMRGSNGVIIITTKKGSSGEAQFNYSANVSVGNVDEKIDVMDGNQYRDFISEYFPDRVNDLGYDDPSNEVVDDPSTPQIEGKLYANTDWQDEIYRTAISTDHTFTARANLYKKIPFRFSLGYNNTEGVVKTSDYERFTYSFKLTPKFFDDHLKVDVNAKGSYSDKNAIDQDGTIYNALTMDPTKPVYDPTGGKFGGYYQQTSVNGGSDIIDGGTNPLALLEQRSRPERVVRFLGNIEFDYKMHFLPELRAVVNLGIDASRTRISEMYTDNAVATYRFNTADTSLDASNNYVFNPGVNYTEDQSNTNTNLDAYLVYTKELNGLVKKYDIQGGYSYQNFIIDGNKEIFRYNTSGLREVQPNDQNPNNRYYNPLNLQAYFARGNVDFAGKYILTASFRAEATSLFQGSDDPWGYFPSAAVAWKMKEESFLKNVSFFDDLKLRLSYGQTGQSSIAQIVGVGYFPTIPLFVPGSSTSQYLPGVNTYTAKAFTPDVTWETTTTYNLGVDFGLFKNSILSGSFDIYTRNTDDLLARVPVPPGQYLANEAIRNIGSSESKGFELNLNAKVINNDNLQIGVGGNIAYSYAEVTDLEGLTQVQASESSIPTQTGLYLAYHAVGEQPYSAWVFQQVYDASGAPVPGAFVDLNGDGTITNDDKYYKALRPNWTYGFNASVNYKNFDLTANFRGQIDGMTYNSSTVKYGFTDRATQSNTPAGLFNVLDFNDGAADATFANFNGNSAFSDYLLEEAWFLRCDNITLGYKFPKFVKKSSLRIYGSVNNAFIVTDYSGQDPENYNAIDNNFYPRPRTYTFGISLDF